MRLIPIKEAARMVSRSLTWIRDRRKDGSIPMVKMGKDWMIRSDVVLKIMREGLPDGAKIEAPKITEEDILAKDELDQPWV